jgi:hypothetical protein
MRKVALKRRILLRLDRKVVGALFRHADGKANM